VSTGTDLLAAAFSQARPRLVRVAYAIIGSHSEAEDVVADCWFRLTAADQDEPVRDVEAWAVVAVSRMALDVLRSARVRRERYVGPWLPEPVVASSGHAAADPADQVTLDDEVSYALLVVMETLSPAERTAFVLHDLFSVSFDEIAAIVGRTPAAVRKLASRARSHVRGQSPWPAAGEAEHRRVVEAFASAAASGDLAALIGVLDPDVVLVSDGGGLVTSARRPVHGADRVARFLLGILAREQPGDAIDRVVVNGALGFAVYQQGQLITVVSVTAASARVTRLDLIRAPGKLPRLPIRSVRAIHLTGAG
jgi:RNA polymerase sigma-70 factor (ECF subfamily)